MFLKKNYCPIHVQKSATGYQKWIDYCIDMNITLKRIKLESYGWQVLKQIQKASNPEQPGLPRSEV